MTTWRLEFAGDGPGAARGSVTLTVPEREGPARYEVVLAGPPIGPGVVVVRDDDVGRPKGRLLEVRADGLWAELVCETPDEHWGFGLEAFGLRYDSEEDAATSDVGERLPVGLDLEWETPDVVRGELLVGRARIPFDGRGTFRVG
jgi:hypothetical protein